jgi:uncharacterized protein (DUF1499 family)
MTHEADAAAQDAGWRGKFAGAALGLSLFAVLWFLIAALGTKAGLWTGQFGLDTLTLGVGRMIVLLAAAVSFAALTISLLAAPRKQPFMLALGAVLIAALAYGRVAAFHALEERLPPLHDIQTDWADPIQPSDALYTEREAVGATNPLEDDPLIDMAANDRWPGTGGRRVADVQEEAEFDTATHEKPREKPYPRIAPLVMPTTPDLAYAAAMAAVTDRGWTLVLADPDTGLIEATEESFWFGFREDIMIRVRADGDGARVDVRSASRNRLSDLGTNARRIRDLLDEIEARIAKGV